MQRVCRDDRTIYNLRGQVREQFNEMRNKVIRRKRAALKKGDEGNRMSDDQTAVPPLKFYAGSDCLVYLRTEYGRLVDNLPFGRVLDLSRLRQLFTDSVAVRPRRIANGITKNMLLFGNMRS